MNRKQYEKPSVEVVVLTQAGMLMVSNDQTETGVKNYNWQTVDEE